MSETEHTDVLIVGAGVAGLTASALLAREGIRAITVSKYSSTAHTPRAHVTNLRSLEVMRDLGIEERVYQTGQIMTTVPNSTYTESLAGREFGRREMWGTRVDKLAEYSAVSPVHMVNIGQHLLEPIINRRAYEFGADIRFLTEVATIEQDDEHVTATVRYRPTGETYTIKAKYVLAADGGRSTIAEQLGFSFRGRGKFGYALNVWFEADLSKYVAHRPGVLYFTYQPGREFLFGSGAFTLVRPWNEWVTQFSYDPEVEELDTRDEVILPRIRSGIGDDTIPIRLKGMNKWQLNSLVAEEYRIGRVFLAGDAAHRHTPAGGLGSNTSLQDSYNLAWKLAAVVRGEAGPSLLDSYSPERQPVGEAVVTRATANVERATEVARSIGISAGQSREEGLSAMDEMFAPGPQGESRRERFNRAVSNIDHGTNALGFEMTQFYRDGAAVIDDGTPWPINDRNPDLFYRQTTHPGAKLPHVWVEREGVNRSTLDVLPAGSWGVVTGPGGEPWLAAAEEVAAGLGIRLAGVSIGPQQDYEDRWGMWAAVREISERGCLLVRPDRHIAWRAFDQHEDALSSLSAAVTTLLARQPSPT